MDRADTWEATAVIDWFGPTVTQVAAGVSHAHRRGTFHHLNCPLQRSPADLPEMQPGQQLRRADERHLPSNSLFHFFPSFWGMN